MQSSNHYRTLGVSQFASDVAVRNAYIALMKRHHGAAANDALARESLCEISIAYWELRHPQRRAAYDAALRTQYRRKLNSAWSKGSAAAPGPLPRHLRSRLQAKWVFFLSVLFLGCMIGWVARDKVPVGKQQSHPVSRPVPLPPLM